jgi:hypothetical protein
LPCRKLDRLSIDENLVLRQGAGAKLRYGAVDADAPGGDPLLDLAARAETGGGK